MQFISRLLFCGIKHFGGKNISSNLLSDLKFYRQCRNLCSFTNTDLLFSNSKVFTQFRYLGTTFKIQHDECRFFIETKEGVAQLKYAINNAVMDIKHTVVPQAMGGHGIGKLLAEAALDYGVEHNLKINISCEFVKSYVNNYGPQYFKFIVH